MNDLINDNNGKCLINQHLNPIIIANRATRRHISKLMVMCPYSTQYRKKNNNQQNDNMNIIGIVPIQNDNICNITGCKWKGTKSLWENL